MKETKIKDSANNIIVVSADYAARINSLRARMMLNQSLMAKRLKVGKSDVSKWENAKSAPNVEQWTRFLVLEDNFNRQEKKLKASKGIPEVKIRHESVGGVADSASSAVNNTNPSGRDGSGSCRNGKAATNESVVASISSSNKSNTEVTNKVEVFSRENILKFRKKFGYSQREIAEMLGISNSTVCQYEAGLYRPSKKIMSALIKIADDHGFYVTKNGNKKSGVQSKTGKSYPDRVMFVPIDTSMQISSFISRYKNFNNRNNVSYDSIADQVGASPEDVRMWESGKSYPSKVQWRKFCKMRRVIIGAQSREKTYEISDNNSYRKNEPMVDIAKNESSVEIAKCGIGINATEVYASTSPTKILLHELLEMLANIPVRDIMNLSKDKREAFLTLISC